MPLVSPFTSVHLGNRNTRNHVTIKSICADILQKILIFRWHESCNLSATFLHGFFRYCLPVEMVDVEVRITSMQGTHTFRRDRTCQVIKCNPWSTILCPHPPVIKKMKTYLEVEGKLGPKCKPQSDQFKPTQPITNPYMRKETKATEKRKKFTPIKKYKVKVVEKPESHNTTT